ncbi:MAG: cob(I)yrinic acid a,c-diamide adenosyltransferase [Verrucomicrobia bacterium]|nr:cob(I)yrinic acid a,c-diamide adenosyltransferase [Verrucomicrobiota bacterium]
MANKIYTRSGDQGKTGLLSGERVDKDDIRIECNGELDEVTSTLGLLRSKLSEDHAWQTNLHRIQVQLMNTMSHIAVSSKAREKMTIPLPLEEATFLESWMDEIEITLGTASDCFLVPGGTEIAALCHVIRTQVRRAERRLFTLHKIDPIDQSILKMVNRLSDLFYKLSRLDLQMSGVDEERWKFFKSKTHQE